MAHKHESVRGYLLEAMRDELGPRGRLPSERQIAEQLGVSRPTVRRALDGMAAEGRVRRIQGSGTFVTEPPTRDLHQHTAQLLGAKEAVAGAGRSWQLGVGPAETLWDIRRLRLADDVPMSMESTYLVKSLAPNLLDHRLDTSLHDLLAAHYDIVIVRAEESVTATVLDAPTAELLEVPPLSPALAIERVSVDRIGRRIEVVRSLCRGDRCAVKVSLERRAR
jgi:GntR family transcriptional regulator